MAIGLDNDTTLQALTASHRHRLRGRPSYYAVLPYQWQGSQGIIKQFYDAIAKLQYRETIGLARSIGVSYATVNRWHYHETMPRRLETMLAVIEWHRAGRPLEVKPRQDRDML